MTGAHCAVLGCSNGIFPLTRWRKTHRCKALRTGPAAGGRSVKKCGCKPPFVLHNFPTEKKNAAARRRWTQRVNRRPDTGTPARPWEPKKNSRVCSEHFVGGAPSEEFPDPCLNLDHPDYESSVFMYPSTSQTRDHCKKRLNRLIRSLKRTPQRGLEFDVAAPSSSKRSLLESPLSSSSLASPQDGTSNPIDPRACHDGFLSTRQSTNTETSTESVTQAVQTEQDAFHREMDDLRRELCDSKLLKSCKFNTELIQANDEKCMYYTGLSWALFVVLVEICESKLKVSAGLSPKEQMFVTLVCLRQNIKTEYLADRLGLAQSSVKEIFWMVMYVLYDVIGFLVSWPDREEIHEAVPKSFRTHFPRLTSMIDCTEIVVERPEDPRVRAEVYSSYRKHSSVKLLMAWNPQGAVTFLSPASRGRANDAEVVGKSGFLSAQYHSPGDQILADRGLTLKEEFALVCGAELVTSKHVDVCWKKSAVVGLLKERYTILNGVIPINLNKSEADETNQNHATCIDVILRVCAALINMKTDISRKEEGETGLSLR